MDHTRGSPAKYYSGPATAAAGDDSPFNDSDFAATPGTATPTSQSQPQPQPTDDELERFRREWKKEVQSRGQNEPEQTAPASRPSVDQPVTRDQDHQETQGQNRDEDEDEEEDDQAPPAPPEAVIYAPAALKYSQGAHKTPQHAPTIAAPAPATAPAPGASRSRLREQIAASAIPVSSSKAPGRPLDPKKSIAGPSTQGQPMAGDASIKSAVEAYAHAVEMERSGQLDQALVSYRKAFRLNTNADRLYHRAQTLLSDPSAPKSTEQSDALLSSPAVADKIRRALDVEDHRYVAIKERQARGEGVEYHATAAAAAATSTSGGADASARTAVALENRPDELAKLLGSLSLANGGERDFDQIAFQPADEEADVPIARLPDEILIHVLRMVIAPRGRRGAKVPKPKPSPEELAAAATGRQNDKRRSGSATGEAAAHPQTQPETSASAPADAVSRPKVVGIGVVLGGADWKSLEMIGRTCWKLRLLSRSQTLWRDIVYETYFPPILDGSISLSSLWEQHHRDWRTVFVNQPRVRLNGCYIAACHYARPGMSEESAWIRVVHVVEFYRSIRFLPDGRCLSLLTTDPPSETVRKLEPSLRTKGFAIGKWELFPNGLQDDQYEHRPPGPKVVVEDLRDRTMQKYAFRMVFSLRQTHRGKWNKLDLLEYFSVNLTNGEVLPLPQKHSRPFHFSRVIPYGI